MDNAIIVGVILVVIVIAVLRTKKHFKGGCCGSGSTSVRSRKKLTEPKIGEKTITLEGLCCENCCNRLEHAVNNLEGVVCRVSLKKQTATISYSREVSDSQLKEIVEKMGYKVTEIR